MYIPSEHNRGTGNIRTIAHLQTAIRHLTNTQMGSEDAAQHLTKISHIIFLLCAFFGRGPEHILVHRIFWVDVRSITRRLGVLTSPQLVREMVSALNLLREHASSFGCATRKDLSLRPPAHSIRQALEEWVRWAPAYLPQRDPHSIDQPWT